MPAAAPPLASAPPAARPRVCYLRGSYLNPFEGQYLERLAERFDITVAHPRSHRYDVTRIRLPRRSVRCLDYANGWLPRTLAGKPVPNPLKGLGYEEVLLGLRELFAGFDLVHVPEQSFHFTWRAAKLREALGFKLVVMQDEVNPFWYAGRKAIGRRAAKVRAVADCFHARTQRARNALICKGVAEDRIEVIGHGVDPRRFAPGPADAGLAQRLGIAPGRLVVLLVGRLLWTKGLWALADAAARLIRDPAARALDPLFLIVGEGADRAGFVRRLRTLGVEERFLLTGDRPYEEIPALHRLADVFVLPSIATRYVLEQFGIAIIEAMATAKPVISTHCGGIDEVIGDAGVLVQPNDSYRLFEQLRRLMLDPGLRDRLGQRGRQRVLDHFTHDRVADAIGSLYERVLA